MSSMSALSRCANPSAHWVSNFGNSKCSHIIHPPSCSSSRNPTMLVLASLRTLPPEDRPVDADRHPLGYRMFSLDRRLSQTLSSISASVGTRHHRFRTLSATCATTVAYVPRGGSPTSSARCEAMFPNISVCPSPSRLATMSTKGMVVQPSCRPRLTARTASQRMSIGTPKEAVACRKMVIRSAPKSTKWSCPYARPTNSDTSTSFPSASESPPAPQPWRFSRMVRCRAAGPSGTGGGSSPRGAAGSAASRAYSAARSRRTGARPNWSEMAWDTVTVT
mmetsp:Transcript_24581/g.62601  ORF Transcript_24581/g.62601 Transcript_24581/m.62601 type:complete len:278 (+) Transcript_24581:176-1009(+)